MNKTKIYLIPGLMNDERLWSRLIPLFDDSYEFEYLKIPNTRDFDEMADILYKEIKDEKINLLGFSLGGYIASYFTCKYPSRVEKLCAIGCTGASMSKDEIDKRVEGIDFIKKYGFKGLSRKKVLTLIEDKSKEDEELIKMIQDMYVDMGEEIFMNQIESTLVRVDLFEKIKALELPVKFIYSNKDRLVSPLWMNKLIKESNKIKFKEFDSTSHMLPLERTMELYGDIKEWIE